MKYMVLGWDDDDGWIVLHYDTNKRETEKAFAKAKKEARHPEILMVEITHMRGVRYDA